MSSEPEHNDDIDEDDDDELDLTLPPVDGCDIKRWLDLAIGQGQQLIEKAYNQWDAEMSGDVPIGTFNQQKFDGVKKSLALYKATRERLQGVIGSGPGVAQADADEQFFALIQNTPWRVDGGKK